MNIHVHAKLLASLLTLTAAVPALAQQDTMPTGAGFNQPVMTDSGNMEMPQDRDDTSTSNPVDNAAAMSDADVNPAVSPGTVGVAPPVEDPATGDAMASPPVVPTDPIATTPPTTDDEMAVQPTETESSLTQSTGQDSSVSSAGGEAPLDSSNSGTEPVTGGVTVEVGKPRPGANGSGATGGDIEARGGDASADASGQPAIGTITTEDGRVYEATTGVEAGLNADTSGSEEMSGTVNVEEGESEQLDRNAQSRRFGSGATDTGS